MKISSREEYHSQHPELLLANTPEDPSELFKGWYTHVQETQPQTGNIMFLSTVSHNARPSTRAVLLREYTNNTYVFYTHYTSRKGQDIKQNPFVALTFYWHDEHRQIRIEGTAEPFSADASNAYFKSRPFLSQVATVTSNQSSQLTNAKNFQADIARLSKEYQGRESELTRPETWGGIIVTAKYYEFWQGRPSRIHERLVYDRSASSEKPPQEKWHKQLLYP